MIDLTAIGKIVEITSPDFVNKISIVDRVNKLLSESWILLKIYTTCPDSEDTNNEIIHYVLGINKCVLEADEDYKKGLIPKAPKSSNNK